MPSLDNVSHLLTICGDTPQAFGWNIWQNRTGLVVMPFGPEADYHELGLRKKEFKKVVRFFERWLQEDGRVLMKKWAGQKWAEWKITDLVGEVLDRAEYHTFKVAKGLEAKEWPNGTDIGVREQAPELALAMFGPEAIKYVGSLMVVLATLLPVAQGLCISVWDGRGRVWKRARAAALRNEKRLASDVAVLEAPDSNPTPTEISRIIQRIKGTLVKSDLFGDKEMMDLVKSWNERLKQMDAVARKVKEAQHDRIPPGLLKALKALADTPTVHFVLSELDQALEREVLPLDCVGDIDPKDFDFTDWLTGVEHLQNKTPEQLWNGLGLPNQSLPAFNDIEDPSGEADPWNPLSWKPFLESGNGIPFGPRWHQLVGITKMCEHIIEGKPLLLMDQVGVGKTLQIVGAIVMYPILRAYFIKHGHFPPHFKNMTCPTPDGNLPDRPHLVVVPPSLFDQWDSEFARYVRFGAIDLLPYRTLWDWKGRSMVWEQVYNLREGKQTLSHKVLLVAYTAAESDCSHRFVKVKKVAPARPDRDPTLPNTMLYDHTFGVVAIDEAGKLRNPVGHWTTMNELAHRAHVTIAATATPITNTPLDLVYIGRAIRIKGCEEPGLLEDMKKNLLKASRKANIEFRTARAEGDFVQRLLNDELQLPEKKKQVKTMTSYTLAIRKIFVGHTIRRALDAVDWEGNPISGLRPYISQQIMLTPSEEEIEALEQTATNVVAEHDTGRTASYIAEAEGHAFYGQFRRTHLHYRLVEDPLWHPESLEDWQENMSTKLKALVDIVLHHLARDNAPPLKRRSADDNELIPDLEDYTPDDVDYGYPDRIVIYMAFPSINHLVVAILRYFGIIVIETNGGKRQSIRSADLELFRNSDRNGPRVCLLSNVGSMGLNLPQANILIALDQLWSHQDLLQLIGRIWRHPQEKQVIVYQPCLEHATDMFLSVLSFSKNALLAAFTQSSRETKSIFRHLLPAGLRDDTSEPESEDEPEPEPTSAPKTKAKTPRATSATKAQAKAKPSAQDESGSSSSEDEDEDEPQPQPTSAPKAKAKTAQPKPATKAQVKAKPSAQDESGSSSSEDEDEDEPQPQPTSAPKAQAKAKPSAQDESGSSSSEDEDEDEPQPTSAPKAKAKAKPSAQDESGSSSSEDESGSSSSEDESGSSSSEDEDEDEPQPQPTSAPKAEAKTAQPKPATKAPRAAGATKAQAKAKPSTRHESSSSEREPEVASTSKTDKKKRKGKAKLAPKSPAVVPTDSDFGDDVQAATDPTGKGKGKAAVKATSKTVKTVAAEDEGEDEDEDPEPKGKANAKSRPVVLITQSVPTSRSRPLSVEQHEADVQQPKPQQKTPPKAKNAKGSKPVEHEPEADAQQPKPQQKTPPKPRPIQSAVSKRKDTAAGPSRTQDEQVGQETQPARPSHHPLHDSPPAATSSGLKRKAGQSEHRDAAEEEQEAKKKRRKEKKAAQKKRKREEKQLAKQQQAKSPVDAAPEFPQFDGFDFDFQPEDPPSPGDRSPPLKKAAVAGRQAVSSSGGSASGLGAAQSGPRAGPSGSSTGRKSASNDTTRKSSSRASASGRGGRADATRGSRRGPSMADDGDDEDDEDDTYDRPGERSHAFLTRYTGRGGHAHRQ